MIPAVFLAFACSRELDLETYTSTEPALCMVSRMSDSDTLHMVHLSISSGHTMSLPPEDSEVQLLENGTPIATTDTVLTESTIQTHHLKATLKPGAEYTLIAKAGSLQAKATVTSVPRYEETAVVTDSSSTKDYRGFREFEKIRIGLADVPGQRSFYWLENNVYGEVIYRKGEKIVDSYRDDYCGKIILKPYIDGGIGKDLGLDDNDNVHKPMFVFSDYHFQDGYFYLEASYSERDLSSYDYSTFLSDPSYDNAAFYLILKLGMMSESDYDYYKLSSYVGSDLFYEPTMLPNNVEGGFGYFGIVSFSEVRIPLRNITMPR